MGARTNRCQDRLRAATPGRAGTPCPPGRHTRTAFGTAERHCALGAKAAARLNHHQLNFFPLSLEPGTDLVNGKTLASASGWFTARWRMAFGPEVSRVGRHYTRGRTGHTPAPEGRGPGAGATA